ALFFLAFSSTTLAADGQALSVEGRPAATVQFPDSRPFRALSSFRVVVRIHNCTAGGADLVGNNLFKVTTDCHSAVIVSWHDHSAMARVAFPDGANDVIIRAERNVANKSLSIETWRIDTGAYRVAVEALSADRWDGTPINMGGQQFVIGGGWAPITAAIDYIRFYSSTKRVGTIPSPNPGGDLGDWEFDGNLRDASTQKLDLTPSGRSLFVQTPLYPPIVTFENRNNCFMGQNSSPDFCVYVAGSPAVLSAAAYSPNENDTLKYSWTQAS